MTPASGTAAGTGATAPGETVLDAEDLRLLLHGRRRRQGAGRGFARAPSGRNAGPGRRDRRRKERHRALDPPAHLRSARSHRRRQDQLPRRGPPSGPRGGGEALPRVGDPEGSGRPPLPPSPSIPGAQGGGPGPGHRDNLPEAPRDEPDLLDRRPARRGDPPVPLPGGRGRAAARGPARAPSDPVPPRPRRSFRPGRFPRGGRGGGTAPSAADGRPRRRGARGRTRDRRDRRAREPRDRGVRDRPSRGARGRRAPLPPPAPPASRAAHLASTELPAPPASPAAAEGADARAVPSRDGGGPSPPGGSGPRGRTAPSRTGVALLLRGGFAGGPGCPCTTNCSGGRSGCWRA